MTEASGINANTIKRGPTIGGVITTQSTWRWVFWFNIPCASFIVAVMLFACPNLKTPGSFSWKQFDFVGCVLYIAGCVLAIFALQEAGTGTIAWDSATFIVCFVISGIAFSILAIWITYLSRRDRLIKPLFPIRIVTHRVMLATILWVHGHILCRSSSPRLIFSRVSTLIGYVFYGVLVELPEQFQIVNDKSPEMAGIYLLAVSGASAVGLYTRHQLDQHMRLIFLRFYTGRFPFQ